MERKRIIIETGEDIADGEEYKALSKKLEAIEKKLSAPWVLPVVLAFVGALLTGGNYLLQRNYNNADLYHNKVQEKVAELRATLAVNFYGDNIASIDSLDEAIHTYCELGPDSATEEIIQNKLSQLNALGRHSYAIDPSAVASIHQYTEFVANKVYYLKPMPAAKEMKKLYQKSTALYKDAYAKLNIGIENLEK
ncbi:hypothetical protein [Mucilaginibacter psychrotolerans]|uniref:Uncharacterized protein n=1 Tax=Mucilaginibacter psychrotolerans TaxID=1524096 RepID=A0A4Y8SBB9_9SPHI|nr:hypothetical protein [Mucilaginibacter psychrotolerans]TFF36319.1 hypothetical protein E2R66_15905 [Mucilaginibacter psychrotolerans]